MSDELKHESESLLGVQIASSSGKNPEAVKPNIYIGTEDLSVRAKKLSYCEVVRPHQAISLPHRKNHGQHPSGVNQASATAGDFTRQSTTDSNELRIVNNRNLSRKDAAKFKAQQKRERRAAARQVKLKAKHESLEGMTVAEAVAIVEPPIHPEEEKEDIPPPPPPEKDNMLNLTGEHDLRLSTFVVPQHCPTTGQLLLPHDRSQRRVVGTAQLSKVLIDNLASHALTLAEKDAEVLKVKLQIRLTSLLKLTKLDSAAHREHMQFASDIVLDLLKPHDSRAAPAWALEPIAEEARNGELAMVWELKWEFFQTAIGTLIEQEMYSLPYFGPCWYGYVLYCELPLQRTPVDKLKLVIRHTIFLINAQGPWNCIHRAARMTGLSALISTPLRFLRLKGLADFAFNKLSSVNKAVSMLMGHFSHMQFNIATTWENRYVLLEQRRNPAGLTEDGEKLLKPLACSVPFFSSQRRDYDKKFCKLAEYVKPAYQLARLGKVATGSYSNLDPLKADKAAPGFLALGFDCGNYNPVKADISNAGKEVSIVGRLLQKTPKVDKVVFAEFAAFSLKNARYLVGRGALTPATPEEVIASLGSSPSTLQKLKDAYVALSHDGVTLETKLNKKELAHLLLIKAHSKSELLTKANETQEGDVKARIIQGEDPLIVALTAGYDVAFNKRFKKVSKRYFTSGMTGRHIAGKLSDHGGTICSDDVEKYDASYQYDMAKLSRQIRQSVYRNANMSKFMVREPLKGVLGTYAYERTACKITGSLTTSSDNSLINLLMHLFAYCKARNVDFLTATREIVMFVQGDDNIASIKGEPIDWKPFLLSLGFVSEAFYPVHSPDLTFCSKIYCAEEKMMIPLVGSVVSKFFNFDNPPGGQNAAATMRGVCLGILSEPRDLIIDALATQALNLLGEGPIIEKNRAKWQMKPENLILPIESSVYSDRYHMSTQSIQTIIEHIRHMDFGDSHHPLMEVILDRDTNGNSVYFPSGPDIIIPPPPTCWSISGKKQNKLIYTTEGNDRGRPHSVDNAPKMLKLLVTLAVLFSALVECRPSLILPPDDASLCGITKMEHHHRSNATPLKAASNVTPDLRNYCHRSHNGPVSTELNMCKLNSEVSSSQNEPRQAVASQKTSNKISKEELSSLVAARFAPANFLGEGFLLDVVTGEVISSQQFSLLCQAVCDLNDDVSGASDSYSLHGPAPISTENIACYVSWDAPADEWSISGRARNRLAHSTNGNPVMSSIGSAAGHSDSALGSGSPSNPLSSFSPYNSSAADLINDIKVLVDSVRSGSMSIEEAENDIDLKERQFDNPNDPNLQRLFDAEAEVRLVKKRNAWAPSSKIRNKRAHAFNGNPPTQKRRAGMAKPRPKTSTVKGRNPHPQKSRPVRSAGRISRTGGAPESNEVRSGLSKPVILRGREMCTTLGTPAVTSAPTDFQNYLQPAIKGGAAFNAFINPGNKDMFPLLSQECLVYEKFKIRKLSYSIVSNVSTSLSGVFQMAIDYDALDVATAGTSYSMRDLALLEGACSETIWDPKALTLRYTPKKDDKRWFYVTELGQTNIPAHDQYPGVISVYGSNPTAAQNQTYGQFWVTYEIEFTGRKKPVPTSASFVQWAMAGVPTSTSSPFLSPTYAVGNSSGFTVLTNNLLEMNPGRYAIHVRQVGTVITGNPAIDVISVVSGSVTAVTLVDGTTVHNGITTGALTSHSYGVYDVAAPATGNLPQVRFVLGAATTFSGSYISIHAVHESFAALPPLTVAERLARLELASHNEVFSAYPSEDECKNMTDSTLLKSVVARLSGK